jgi:transglutaminase-like putative cysteine protease
MLKATQNTLFLLGVIAVVIAPHAPQLPWWCTAFAATVLVWRAWIAYKGLALPGRWVVALALAACVWGVFATHTTLLGTAAGTTLVVVLLALKTLELRAQRDAFVVFFLGFFVLMANFLESQSLGIALAMVVGMAGLLASLVNAQLAHEEAGFKTAAWQALKLMVWGAPLMAFLFVFFPRVAPLWALPNDAAGGQTGLSEDMTVGRIADLAKSDEIALRVKFSGPPPSAFDLYFRGPILSQFDGQTWRPTATRPLNPSMPEALVTGPSVSYEVTLEPHQRNWVMTLDLTPQPPDWPNQTLGLSPDFQWYSSEAITTTVRYKATSYPKYQYGLNLTPLQMRESLFLPKDSNPRIQALAAAQLAEPGFSESDAMAKAQWAMQQLAAGGYRYTLSPGVYGRHSADEFWFDRKQGFCEHIAASFVIMMRAMGVPARVVTGYQGGELNAVDGFWLVRQSDAHAWVEVWAQPGSGPAQGWVRFDPTGVVAPERVQSATRLEPQRGPVGSVVSQILGKGGVDWLRKVRGLWEASENLWTQKILNFNRDQQFEFLKKLGFEAPSEETLGQAMAGVFALGLLLFAVLGKAAQWRWLQWLRWQRQDPWQALWSQVKADAMARGLAVDASTTPRKLAVLVGHPPGPLNAASPSPPKDVVAWLLRFEALRYASTEGQGATQTGGKNQLLATFKQEWKALNWRHNER